MPEHIPFADNYQDLSTDRGFQFKFNCERCGNGYLSSFQHNVTGLAGDALRAAGGLLGGFLGRAANSMYDVQRAVGGPAHDAALRKAVEEMQPQFQQCGRCGQWVCHEVCWNGARGQCVNCSPKMDEEISPVASDVTIQPIRENSQDLVGGVAPESAAALTCPSCGSEVAVGKKFCGECGANVLARRKCASCGAESDPGTKFCGECGGRLGAQQ